MVLHRVNINQFLGVTKNISSFEYYNYVTYISYVDNTSGYYIMVVLQFVNGRETWDIILKFFLVIY